MNIIFGLLLVVCIGLVVYNCVDKCPSKFSEALNELEWLQYMTFLRGLTDKNRAAIAEYRLRELQAHRNNVVERRDLCPDWKPMWLPPWPVLDDKPSRPLTDCPARYHAWVSQYENEFDAVCRDWPEACSQSLHDHEDEETETSEDEENNQVEDCACATGKGTRTCCLS